MIGLFLLLLVSSLGLSIGLFAVLLLLFLEKCLQ